MENNNICAKCKYFTNCGGATGGAPCDGYDRITRADILKAIQETRATIETLENAKKQYRDAWRGLFEDYKKAARDNGPEAARIGEKISDLNTKITILKNNYRIALFDETIPAVVTVLKKYNGKQYGPKTREKIRDEIKAAAGVSFYINIRTWCDEIIISDDYLRYSEQLEINTRADENGERPRLLIDNKISAPEADQLSMYYNNFIDDPAVRVMELKAAYKNARAAQNELKNKCGKYNDLIVHGIEPIYPEKHLY